MDLFGFNPGLNLLPYDGTVNYYGCIVDHFGAQKYFELLFKNIHWKHDEAFLYGKKIITARKVAWYGDGNYSYTYSGTTKHAQIWTEELFTLKSLVEQQTKTKFNSCLLNLYHTGDEGMAWHSDDEKSLGRNSTIASLSFGAERKFSFKHKETGHTISLQLENGSLLVMKGTTQTNWFHRLPKSTKTKTPRINLTFRTILSKQELDSYAELHVYLRFPYNNKHDPSEKTASFEFRRWQKMV